MQLYKELVVLLPLTPELPVTPCALGWICVRDAFPPLPTALSIVLSLKFLCCYKIYNPIRICLLCRYLDDSRGYYEGIILCVHKK